MTQENQTQLSLEEFISRYRELNSSRINGRAIERDSRIREAYSSFYNPNGRRITLLSNLEDDSYCFENMEDILKLDGAIVNKFMPYSNEAYRIKEYAKRHEQADNERQQAIDESNDLIVVSPNICDVVFSPFVFRNVQSKDNTILFLPEKDLTTICSQDIQLIRARELKKEGKNISIVVTRYNGFSYRFL